MQNTETEPVVFECAGAQLLGILHRPERARRRGVLIITGGPQYRIGSHRQFVMMGRALCRAGYPVFRFDFRGMGDSDGPIADFERAGPDIIEAYKVFSRIANLNEVVIWGLCDGASATLMNLDHSFSPAGLVLVNPWVRSPSGLAQAQIKHYYREQIFSKEAWRRILTRKLNILDVINRFLSTLGSSLQSGQTAGARADFRSRMITGLETYGGKILLILSGNDLTAREFEDFIKLEKRWRSAFSKLQPSRRILQAADHTFSSKHWQTQVEVWTVDWLGSW